MVSAHGNIASPGSLTLLLLETVTWYVTFLSESISVQRDNKQFKKCSSEAGKMAQSRKCLVYKRDHLISVSQNPSEKQGKLYILV